MMSALTCFESCNYFLREFIETWSMTALYSCCFWYQLPVIATCLLPFSALPMCWPISCTFPVLWLSSMAYCCEMLCGCFIWVPNTLIGVKPCILPLVTSQCEAILGDRVISCLNRPTCLLLEVTGGNMLSCAGLHSWSFHFFSSFCMGVPMSFLLSFCSLIWLCPCTLPCGYSFLSIQNALVCCHALPAQCNAMNSGARAATTDLPYKIIEPIAGFCMACPCCFPIGGMTYSFGGLIMTFWNGCSASTWTLTELCLAGTREDCICLPSIEGLTWWLQNLLGTLTGRMVLCSRLLTGISFCPNALCLLGRNFNACCYYVGAVLTCSPCCCIGVPLVSLATTIEGCGLCTSWWNSLLGDWIANQTAMLIPAAEDLVDEADFFDLLSLFYLSVCGPTA